MSGYALIDDEDGAWIAGPLMTPPSPPAGFVVIEIADGWPDTLIYDVATRSFVPLGPRISRLEYFLLFTAAEQLAIANSTVETVALARYALSLADVVDLSSPIITGPLAGFVALGLLAPDRPARIIANLPPEPA